MQSRLGYLNGAGMPYVGALGRRMSLLLEAILFQITSKQPDG